MFGGLVQIEYEEQKACWNRIALVQSISVLWERIVLILESANVRKHPFSIFKYRPFLTNLFGLSIIVYTRKKMKVQRRVQKEMNSNKTMFNSWYQTENKFNVNFCMKRLSWHVSYELSSVCSSSFLFFGRDVSIRYFVQPQERKKLCLCFCYPSKTFSEGTLHFIIL